MKEMKKIVKWLEEGGGPFPINKDSPPFFAWTTNPLHQEHGGRISVEFFPGGPAAVRERVREKLSFSIRNCETIEEAKAIINLAETWKEEYSKWEERGKHEFS